MQLGDAVIDKLIGKELYGHTNWRSEEFSINLFFFITPTLFFLSRFAPWSILSIWGLWMVWKRPATETQERLFERFLASYFCFGIILFSIFPHQRPDHLFPLLPAAGLLAGRAITRWVSLRNYHRYVIPSVIGFWLLATTGFAVYYYKIDPVTNPWFAKTEGVRQLAGRYIAENGSTDRLHFVDTPYGLQFYLNTMKHRISYEAAARLLIEDDGAIVAVRSVASLKKYLPPEFSLHMVMRWPETESGFIYLVGNAIAQTRAAPYHPEGEMKQE
jgi:hypothetical protein